MIRIPSNIGSNNMILWILTFLSVPIIQLFTKGKPLNPSYGILKYADPYFESWSEFLVKTTILENNRLTSSKTKCRSALDPLFGHCLHVSNLEDDPRTLVDLASLSPFHIFCYTVIRRCLEIISLYLVRWLPLGSLSGLLSSSCALIWIYFSKRWTPKKVTTATKGISAYLLQILLVFLCSAAVCLSFLVPIGLELVVGGIIDSQLAGIFKDDSHRFTLEKVFFSVIYQNNSRATVYDFFYFHCLRKTLFDLEKSEMERSFPRNTEERLLLQMKLSVMNVTSFLVFAMLYVVIILFGCLFMRMIVRCLTAMLSNGNSNNCYKKVLKPGLKEPWKELNFTTRIENSNNKDQVKRKRSSHPIDKMRVVLARRRKDDEPLVDEKKNPDSSKKERLASKPPSKQSSRNSSKVSVKEAEMIKPAAKESLPAVSNQRKTENKTSQTGYVDVGTYVCFDSEDSSDQSDFEFLHY